jgi:hypothetical protein
MLATYVNMDNVIVGPVTKQRTMKYVAARNLTEHASSITVGPCDLHV